MKLSGWGRFPAVECRLAAPRDGAGVAEELRQGQAIARGNGRGYGDCAINARATLAMRHFDHMESFDPACGLLVAEAGVLLADVIDTFLPRGWFPMVTPGTRFVTLGGMLAADVHGKNHHRDGSFRSCVDWFDLLGEDGIVRRCSRHENADLFDWSHGGMGLTGVILRIAMRLRKVETGWIRQVMIPAPDLDAAMAAFEAAQDATYSVAWIDCLASGARLGRSLVMVGEHAQAYELMPSQRERPFDIPRKSALAVPCDVPPGLLNSLTVKAFNQFYYWNGKRQAGYRLVDWASYFYPLDSLLHWNRIYGGKGFVQFQCVIPLDRARAGLQALLGTIARAGSASFLAVLKRFGQQEGRFAFPMPGYTLALDFPVTPATLRLLDELDEIVIAHAGRFYLAKDSRMTAETLRRSDARSADYRAFRNANGMDRGFGSAQSERLGL